MYDEPLALFEVHQIRLC